MKVKITYSKDLLNSFNFLQRERAGKNKKETVQVDCEESRIEFLGHNIKS